MPNQCDHFRNWKDQDNGDDAAKTTSPPVQQVTQSQYEQSDKDDDGRDDSCWCFERFCSKHQNCADGPSVSEVHGMRLIGPTVDDDKVIDLQKEKHEMVNMEECKDDELDSKESSTSKKRPASIDVNEEENDGTALK